MGDYRLDAMLANIWPFDFQRQNDITLAQNTINLLYQPGGIGLGRTNKVVVVRAQGGTEFLMVAKPSGHVKGMFAMVSRSSLNMLGLNERDSAWVRNPALVHTARMIEYVCNSPGGTGLSAVEMRKLFREIRVINRNQFVELPNGSTIRIACIQPNHPYAIVTWNTQIVPEIDPIEQHFPI